MFRLFHICLVLSQDKKRGMIMMMLTWTMTLSSFRKEVIWTMTALMPFLLYLLRNHEPLGRKYQTYHGRFYGGYNVIMVMMMAVLMVITRTYLITMSMMMTALLLHWVHSGRGSQRAEQGLWAHRFKTHNARALQLVTSSLGGGATTPDVMIL